MEEIELHENPIPVVLQPTKIYNNYEIRNVYKVNFFLFLLGLFFGFLISYIFAYFYR